MTEENAAKVRRFDPAEVPLNCWCIEIGAAMTEDPEAASGLCLTTRRIVASHLKSAEA